MVDVISKNSVAGHGRCRVERAFITHETYCFDYIAENRLNNNSGEKGFPNFRRHGTSFSANIASGLFGALWYISFPVRGRHKTADWPAPGTSSRPLRTKDQPPPSQWSNVPRRGGGGRGGGGAGGRGRARRRPEGGPER